MSGCRTVLLLGARLITARNPRAERTMDILATDVAGVTCLVTAAVIFAAHTQQVVIEF